MTSPSLPETETPVPVRGRHARWPWVAALVVVLGGMAAAAWYLNREEPLPAGVSERDYQRGEQRFREIYGKEPSRLDVLSLLGEVAVADGRDESAVACFRAIPTGHPRYGLPARLQEAQAFVRLKRAAEAERSFREYLSHAVRNPSEPQANLVAAYKWLTYLLSVELRFEERKEFLGEMQARGLADVFDSKQYYFPHLLVWYTASGSGPLTEFLERTPGDARLAVALARYRVYEGRLDEAQALLEEILRRDPGDLRAAAALLECHYEANDWEAFARVLNSLPAYADGEPWLLTRMRGEFASHEKRWDVAVLHFEQLLKQDPTDPACHMGLARAYGELGRDADRDEMQKRSLVLADIRVGLVNVTEDAPEACVELAAACDRIGLPEAAETFQRHAARIRRAKDAAPSSGAPAQL
ncbi:MAG TPA: tetratricopeptide repeat protein [Planctomycetaceae bacterium]